MESLNLNLTSPHHGLTLPLGNSILPKRAGCATKMNEGDVPKYSMIIEWSSDDDAFIVTIPELAGSRTHGESYAAAVKNGQEIIDLVVAGLVQDGQELPVASYFQNGELVELRSHRDRKVVRRAS